MNNIPFFSAVSVQIISLLLYNYGPWNYIVNPKVNILVMACLLSCTLGYITSTRRIISGPQIDSRKFIKYATLSSLVLILPTYFARVGFSLPNLNSSLGELYSSAGARSDQQLSFIEYLRMPFGWLIFGLLPLTLVFWKEIPKILKNLAIAAIFLNLSIYILTGTNKLLFDYMIIALTVSPFYKFKIRNIPKLTLIVIVSCTFLAIALTFFAKTQETRSGSGSLTGVFPAANVVAKSMPDLNVTVRSGYYGLTSYLTQGYYALGLSLDRKFIWTYGVGNSTFISRQFDRLTGLDASDQTYPARIEDTNWDRYRYWSSVYSWFASDITFYGLPVLFFILGFGIKLTSNSALLQKNPIAIILNCQLIIGLFYACANNQLFQSGESFFTFLILLLLFFFLPISSWRISKNRVVNKDLVNG